ncbi:MAG: DpnD/PcfM family protein [Methylococcaceae bacterium]
MKTFKVQIEEQLSRTALVEAHTEEEAYSKIKKSYFDEEIILSDNDFVQVDFIVIEN